MWILLNNKPVCVFDIQKVSEILTLTNYAFYNDNILACQSLGNMFPNEYEEYRKDLNKFMEKKKETDENPFMEKAQFNANRLYGHYFTVTFKNGECMYSTLYAEEGTTTYVRDFLLRKINRTVADLERITI